MIIGVGGVGGRALKKFRKLPKSCSLLAVDTDEKDLAKLPGRIGKLLIGKKTLGGRKPKKASEVGLAVKEDLGEIRKRLRGASLVFVLAASGGLGMAGAPRLVVIAKKLGAKAVWATSRPAGSVIDALGLRERKHFCEDMRIASEAFLDGAVDVIEQVVELELGKRTKAGRVKR